METLTETRQNNTRTIAKNSVWYGIETVFVFFTAFVCTVMMARVLGPEKLGYFNYVMWLANVSGAAGSLGIPVTTRKYMAEYLGRGEHGTVRAIFGATMRLQCAMAGAITVVGLALVWFAVDPAYRWPSLFQVASIFPSMAVFVPAQANIAKEDMKANVAGSLIGTFLYLAAVVLSLWLGWGILGIAIGIFVSRSLELFVRLVPVLRWVGSLPKTVLSPELKRRMVSFSGQGSVLMLLSMVVWDRSDIVFLKMLSTDIAQVTFFTVAFNLTQRAFFVPDTFGAAIGASMMAQYGRDKSRLPSMVSTSFRYMLLFSAPLLLGMAALSGPLMTLIYGHQYIPAIPVLMVAALMAVPKALLVPVRSALQAHEDQKFLIAWTALCGVINVALDFVLIPRLAATGATIANGTAQLMAVVGLCIWVTRSLRVRWQAGPLLKIAFATICMGLVVAFATRGIRLPAVAVLTGVPLGAACFFVLLKLTRALGGDDHYRLVQIGARIPAAVRLPYERAVGWLVTTGSASAAVTPG